MTSNWKRNFLPPPSPKSRVFLAGAILLLALGGMAPEALAQKGVPFETQSEGGRFHFRGPDGTLFAEADLSPNFVIYYNHNEVSLELVDFVLDTLEEAWNHYQAAGYRHPAFADGHLVAVYIRSSFGASEQWAAGFYRLFPRSGDPYIEMRNYDIGVGNNRAFLRSICTHEFFHFIQHAYDANFSPDARWMWEATATWSEDEITPSAPATACFLRHMPTWYLLWGMGLPLKSFNQRDANIRLMPYGGALYFKYLSEHLPAGATLIRQLWENASAMGPNDSMRVIENTVGVDQFGKLFADFAAAVIVKTLAPWDFRRGNEISRQIIPRSRSRNWYFQSWDPSAHRIERGEYPLEPFTASYFDFTAPNGQAVATRLRLVVERPSPAILAKAIRFSGANLREVGGVDDVPFREGKPAAQLLVENFGLFSDRTNRVLLVVVNPTASQARVKIAAAVSEPPFLRNIRVDRPGKGLVYEAVWEEAGRNRKRLNVLKNELKLEPDEERVEDLRLTLTFSREIQDPPSVRIGGQEVRMADPSNRRRTWMGQVGTISIPQSLKKLPIVVQASSPDGLQLDVNPESSPSLDSERLEWNGYEQGGGPDDFHVIKVKKLDLNGLWKSGGTLVRIQHRGRSIQGMTMGGKLLLQGTLNGTQIGGQMRVRYPPEWQARCPGKAEGWAALELAVAEDENHLTGRFELKKIDESCNEVPQGWKDLTLERLPENRPGGRA